MPSAAAPMAAQSARRLLRPAVPGWAGMASLLTHRDLAAQGGLPGLAAPRGTGTAQPCSAPAAPDSALPGSTAGSAGPRRCRHSRGSQGQWVPCSPRQLGVSTGRASRRVWGLGKAVPRVHGAAEPSRCPCARSGWVRLSRARPEHRARLGLSGAATGTANLRPRRARFPAQLPGPASPSASARAKYREPRAPSQEEAGEKHLCPGCLRAVGSESRAGTGDTAGKEDTPGQRDTPVPVGRPGRKRSCKHGAKVAGGGDSLSRGQRAGDTPSWGQERARLAPLAAPQGGHPCPVTRGAGRGC